MTGVQTCALPICKLVKVYRTVADLHGLRLPSPSPFEGLRFKKAGKRRNAPFSTDWIRGRLLAPGALDGLNAEARDAFLIMVNTGARPGEIVGCLPEELRVEADIPHMRIRERDGPDGRRLKNAQSERDVPLVGVSLEAARRIVQAGGFSRYFLDASKWSAVVTKFLTKNKLRETPQHKPYGLRHSFEDRLQEAGIDDRLRAELMGHKYERPAYGEGGSLKMKAAAVARIAL